MSKVISILFLTLCLFSQGTPVAQTPSTKFKGFLGTYHPVKGTAYGGPGWTEGVLMQHAFNFGQNAILVKGSHLGYTFEENISNSCSEWDVNRMYGILLPPSEFGAVNQPKDSDLLKPFEKQPGMIQGAHRFSELSKRCPQIAGVIIDDFFNDFPKEMTLEDLRDLKDALLGKTIDAEGNVDNSSTPTTPDLKLYIVVYEHHLDRQVDPQALKLLDGVCFWMWKQTEHYKHFDDYMTTVNRLYPGKEVISGVYVRHSREVPVVPSVHHIMERAIDLYAKGRINGLLIFSAIWLSREETKPERWSELALPQFLGRLYYPFLGEGKGRVVDARTRKPIKGALVSVSRIADGKLLPATRKLTNERGEYHFGGWAGNDKKSRVDYEIRIENVSFKTHTMRVNLRANQSVNFADARLRS
ncbi:MAG TPA: carboxypeptidase-like regulatory domain-containing protein [Pyrinomonadaceae bacterium]|nr:carboxypeptidase-like regulatory domain-containing protein [Pyrinomonadaceae bacterium]